MVNAFIIPASASTISSPNYEISSKLIASESATIIEVDGNTTYFVDGLTLNRVVSQDSPNIYSNAVDLGDVNNVIVSKDFIFYSIPLTSSEADLISTDATMRETLLTKADEATDSMSSVRASLSVSYTSSSTDTYLPRYHIHGATGKTVQLHSEGVTPQNSSLDWTFTGSKYVNSQLQTRGTYGNTKYFSTPDFTNYAVMPENESYRPDTTGGITYTCKCARGVSVSVNLSFAGP